MKIKLIVGALMVAGIQYKISLLGSFQVYKGEEEAVHFEADSARALLAYLAVDPETAHARETLASLIWPDHDRSAGFNNLRQALKRLKDAVEDESDSPLILAEKRTIRINPEADIWVDTLSFEKEIQQANANKVEEAIPYLESALQLYRGEFLRDFHIKSYPFEEWQSTNQAKYHEQVLLALSKVSVFYYHMGDYDAVVQYSRKILELEPWYEEAQRQLMIAMSMNNQRNRALYEYLKYRNALKSYLDIEPEIETIEIYHRVRSGELGRKSSTPRTPRRNFPAALTAFIGRHDELREIQQELANPDRRLITLVGRGGVGKTRLALASVNLAGDDFPGGAVFVPMEIPASKQKNKSEIVKDENYLPAAVADGLGLRLFGNTSPKEQVFEYLKTLTMLIVFDNFEDVIETAPILVELLQRCPDVTILVTSRERLNLQAETVVRIEGLVVPVDPDTARPESFPSVQLFMERASRIPVDYELNDEMDAIIQICRLVEGLPLGLELAANLVEVMTPTQIAENIQEDIDVLSSTMKDLPERHRSIRVVFESSWRILNEEEQELFARLSVFSGGFELDAAVEITKGDEELVRSLRDKSLLVEVGGERFAIHTVLRQLAEERLKRAKSVKDRHSRYYLKLLANKEKEFGARHTRQMIEKLSLDLANIRQAWLWASMNKKFNLLEKSLNSFYRFYNLRGLQHEGQLLVDDVLFHLKSAKDKIEISPKFHSRLLINLGWFNIGQDRIDEGFDAAQKAVKISKQNKDHKALASAYLVLANVSVNRGRWDEAVEACQHSLKLARRHKVKYIEVRALLQIGLIHSELVEYEEALSTYQEGLDLLDQDEDLPIEVDLLNALGGSSYQLGRYDQAISFYERGLEINQEAGNYRMVGLLWNNLADVMARLGDPQTALVYYAKSQQNSLLIGDRGGQGLALQSLANVSLLLGNSQAALAHAEQALKLTELYDLGPIEGLILNRMGKVHLSLENFSEAEAFFNKALEHNIHFGRMQFNLDSYEGLARLSLLSEKPKKALTHVEKILAYINEHSISGAIRPMRIYLTCYQVLAPIKDPRACEIIEKAYINIQTQAANIENEDLKQSFFENVAVHQQIIQAHADCGR